MKKAILTSFTLLVSAGLLMGCGGSGGGIDSGVDESKPANEVTDDEAEDICVATADYVASKVDGVELGCRTTGFTAGILALADGDEAMQEACTDAYDVCIDDAPEEPEEADCSDASASAADCEDDITVGEVQDCLKDRVDQAVTTAELIPSCSELTLDYLEELAENPPEEPESPASCEIVEDACPGFATGE